MSQLKNTNDIESIEGIMNGTTNYILDKMTQLDSDYDSTLKKAQHLGFAETDPTDDVDGYDAQSKLCVLSSIAYGGSLRPDQIYCRGITSVTSKDIQSAKFMGYTVKLIASVIKKDNSFCACVEPLLLAKDSIFANVHNAQNIVSINGSNIGKLELQGAGAGKMPTANAVVCDLIDIIEFKGEKSSFSEYNLKLSFEGINAFKGKYYVRITPKEEYDIALLIKRFSDSNIDCKIFRDIKELILVTEEVCESKMNPFMKHISKEFQNSCYMRFM